MTVEKILYGRSVSNCELCGVAENLGVYEVPPAAGNRAETAVLICATCRDQIEDPEKVVVQHWRCLNDSMWSQVPAVQVLVWRMLERLRDEGWPRDLVEMLYLDEATLAWAKATDGEQSIAETVKHIDSNGVELGIGDTVTLIKDLNVKGASFTAKRGTIVRAISLVADNPEQIEGRVNGQQIVLLTKFVKKSN